MKMEKLLPLKVTPFNHSFLSECYDRNFTKSLFLSFLVVSVQARPVNKFALAIWCLTH